MKERVAERTDERREKYRGQLLRGKKGIYRKGVTSRARYCIKGEKG